MNVKRVQFDSLLRTNKITKFLLANIDICVAKALKGRFQMRAFSTLCTLKAAASYSMVTKPPTAQMEHPSPSRLRARMAGADDGKSPCELPII